MIDSDLMKNVLAGEFSPAEKNVWKPESHWDEHAIWHVEDWMYEVACRNTRQSYVEWVNSQIAQEREE